MKDRITLPTVVSAEYESGYLLRLAFSDHTTKTVDFRKWLDGPIFEPLKDPVYFQRFFLDGGTVAWPNGADVAPETLYEEGGVRARRPNNQMQRTRSATVRRRGPRR